MNTSNENYTRLVDSVGFRAVLPALGIILGLFSVTFNFTVCMFFRKKTSQVMQLIYFSMACTDMLSGFMAIYQGVAVILGEMFPQARVYLYSVFFGFLQLSFHVSAFQSVQLTVARTISISFPLYACKRSSIIKSTVFYTLLWLGLILAEWVIAYEVTKYLQKDLQAVVDILYIYPRAPGIIIDEVFWNIGEQFYTKTQKVSKGLITAISIFIPYGVPSIICLISAVLQVRQIIHNMRGNLLQEKSQKRNRKMTITIIMLTTAFFICNTTYFITVILDATIELNHSGNYKNLFLLLIASNHLLFLNSALTPFILILRGNSVRGYITNKMGVTRAGTGSSSHAATNNDNGNHTPAGVFTKV